MSTDLDTRTSSVMSTSQSLFSCPLTDESWELVFGEEMAAETDAQCREQIESEIKAMEFGLRLVAQLMPTEPTTWFANGSRGHPPNSQEHGRALLRLALDGDYLSNPTNEGSDVNHKTGKSSSLDHLYKILDCSFDEMHRRDKGAALSAMNREGAEFSKLIEVIRAGTKSFLKNPKFRHLTEANAAEAAASELWDHFLNPTLRDEWLLQSITRYSLNNLD